MSAVWAVETKQDDAWVLVDFTSTEKEAEEMIDRLRSGHESLRTRKLEGWSLCDGKTGTPDFQSWERYHLRR